MCLFKSEQTQLRYHTESMTEVNEKLFASLLWYYSIKLIIRMRLEKKKKHHESNSTFTHPASYKYCAVLFTCLDQYQSFFFN